MINLIIQILLFLVKLIIRNTARVHSPIDSRHYFLCFSIHFPLSLIKLLHQSMLSTEEYVDVNSIQNHHRRYVVILELYISVLNVSAFSYKGNMVLKQEVYLGIIGLSKALNWVHIYCLLILSGFIVNTACIVSLHRLD